MSDEKSLTEAIQMFAAGEFDKCASIIESAALNNEVRAMEIYGLMLQFGTGVERDVAKAITFFERAAQTGSGVAAHNLGTLYITCGEGGNPDFENAAAWFNRAKELGFIVSGSDPIK